MAYWHWLLAAAFALGLAGWYGAPWWLLRARRAGLGVGPGDVALIRLRGERPAAVLGPLLRMARGGVAMELRAALDFMQAGGDLEGLAAALVEAREHGVALGPREGVEIALAGRDLGAVVRRSWEPGWLELPEREGEWLRLEREGWREALLYRLRVEYLLLPGKLFVADSLTTLGGRARRAVEEALEAASGPEEACAEAERFGRLALEEKLPPINGYQVLGLEIVVEGSAAG